MAMDIRKIKQLIDLVKEQGIGELEVKEDKDSVRISQFQAVPVAQPSVHQFHPQLNHPQPVKQESSVTEPAAVVESNKAQRVIKSPMVGTVYLRANPNADLFVKVGQQVVPGDVVCLVEAMKMFNQIESEHSGKIARCLVSDSQPVEFGQDLFVIE